MCGIAGIYAIELELSKVRSDLEQMCQQIAHRGMDDEGFWYDSSVALGHRRLSILDLSKNGKQPMQTADQRYQIVFNGEIYNFQSVRKELQTQYQIVFQSRSDTEVILYAYATWGVNCLSKLNGMFAFAIWDSHTEELFLARDYFGEKPLYYTFTNKQFYFASEVSAITAVLPQAPNINNEGLNHFLALGYILTPQTIYENIFQLPSAHYLKIKLKDTKGIPSLNPVRYWNYADTFRQPKTQESEFEIKEHLLNLLRDSVRSRMISDVPVGAFLSGGVDSSSIVALMKEVQAEKLHTFSAGFQQEGYNELPDALKVAKHFDTLHHSHILTPKSESEIRNVLQAYSQPLADNALIPLVELSQKVIEENIKVVLSGDGADEILMGYVTYDADRYYKYSQILPYFVKKILAKRQPLNPSSQKFTWRYKIPQFFYATLGDYREAHYSWRLIFRPEERLLIMGNEFKELIYDTDPFRVFKQHYQEVTDLPKMEQHLYVDAMTWLTDDILVKTDRATMWAGVEGRCPFLDKDLVSYVAKIPTKYKIGKGKKYILKQAIQNILPEYVLNKKKSGFNAPVNQWIPLTEGKNEFQVFTQFVWENWNINFKQL